MISIITGGAGFIGSHLAEKLISLGHKVIIIDNFSNGKINNIKSFKNKIKLIKADISKANSKWTNCFKKADYVFHLAALADIVPSINHPRKYFNSNVVGTFNVLEACRENKFKFYMPHHHLVMAFKKISTKKARKYLQNILLLQKMLERQ